MRMADNGNNKWAMACTIDLIFLLARESIVMVLLLLLARIVRVHYLYLNPQICEYQIFSTDIL